MNGVHSKNLIYKNGIFFAAAALVFFLAAVSGCGGGGQESDNPDDMIAIEGSVSQSVLPASPRTESASSGRPYSIDRAIASEGDMVFLFLNGDSVGSTQIQGGKYKFYGGYKGRRLSLKFGLTNNEVFVGTVASDASGTIVLPEFDEYHVIAKKVIEVQAAEGRTKLDNFIVSNGRLDLTATVNTLRGLLASKFLAEPDIYGSNAAQLIAKINNLSIDANSAFSYRQLKIFADIPKTIAISPGSYSLGVREQGQFTVSMSGFTDKSLVYKVNDMIGGSSAVGTITQSGLYTAPGTIDLQTAVTVSAQSVEDTTQQASALVVLTPLVITLNGGKDSISLSTLDKDYNMPYTVTGHGDKRLRWYVNDIEFGNILTVGYISSAGRYSQPAKIPSVKITVKAISVADDTKSDACEIIITQ